MVLPSFPEARLYYRAALQRYEDAEFLMADDRTTGAVYLAGYGVECILKALVLASISNAAERQRESDGFRGPRAHDSEWLKQRYVARGRTVIHGPTSDFKMAKTKKKPPDANLRSIRQFLRKYEADNPKSTGAAYRRNPASIRIRIVDPRFKGLDRVEREELVWPLLDALPDEAHADITFLLLLTPDELETSPGNYEFEHPLPSRL